MRPLGLDAGQHGRGVIGTDVLVPLHAILREELAERVTHDGHLDLHGELGELAPAEEHGPGVADELDHPVARDGHEHLRDLEVLEAGPLGIRTQVEEVHARRGRRPERLGQILLAHDAAVDQRALHRLLGLAVERMAELGHDPRVVVGHGLAVVLELDLERVVRGAQVKGEDALRPQHLGDLPHDLRHQARLARRVEEVERLGAEHRIDHPRVRPERLGQVLAATLEHADVRIAEHVQRAHRPHGALGLHGEGLVGVSMEHHGRDADPSTQIHSPSEVLLPMAGKREVQDMPRHLGVVGVPEVERGVGLGRVSRENHGGRRGLGLVGLVGVGHRILQTNTPLLA